MPTAFRTRESPWYTPSTFAEKTRRVDQPRPPPQGRRRPRPRRRRLQVGRRADRVEGLPTQAAQRDVLLLRACVRAGQTPGAGQLRWVPDATLLLRHSAGRLGRLEIGVRGNAGSRWVVAIGLRYLQGRFAPVATRLSSSASSECTLRVFERRELAARLRQTGHLTGLKLRPEQLQPASPASCPLGRGQGGFPVIYATGGGSAVPGRCRVEGSRRVVTELRARRPGGGASAESRPDAAK